MPLESCKHVIYYCNPCGISWAHKEHMLQHMNEKHKARWANVLAQSVPLREVFGDQQPSPSPQPGHAAPCMHGEVETVLNIRYPEGRAAIARLQAAGKIVAQI